MSLKAIELQIALPRTYDVGKIQDQQDHKHQHMYNLAAQEMSKEEEKKRTTVIKGEVNAKINNRKRREKENTPLNENGEQDEIEEEVHSFKVQHPYKGTRIDYSR
ncbi:MAG TPA: hypothetical protein VNR61_04515 [Niallia sp.]|nr:hypothetical protein [Niallia sp.]